MMNTTLINDRRIILTTLWVFILFNMIYADILNTLKPGYLVEIENVGKTMSGEMVLIFAFLMEIPIVMILLSRFLKPKWNRIANIIASIISILWVILPSFVLGDIGNTPLSYLFFASIETITMLFIIWFAWNWKEEKTKVI
jgi:hypothetical protein